MKENLFGKEKRTHTKSMLKAEKLTWLDDISEWKLQVGGVVLN